MIGFGIPGARDVAIRAQSRIMIAWLAVTFCTHVHSSMIDRNFQPGIGDMTGTALCRIVTDRTDMTGTAIAQSVIKGCRFPSF